MQFVSDEAYKQLGVFHGTTAIVSRDVYERRQARQGIALRTAAEIEAMEKKTAELQAFKDYVHKRLDDAGVPAAPESPHTDAGCRVGGRLDLVLPMPKA